MKATKRKGFQDSYRKPSKTVGSDPNNISLILLIQRKNLLRLQIVINTSKWNYFHALSYKHSNGRVTYCSFLKIQLMLICVWEQYFLNTKCWNTNIFESEWKSCLLLRLIGTFNQVCMILRTFHQLIQEFVKTEKLKKNLWRQLRENTWIQ